LFADGFKANEYGFVVCGSEWGVSAMMVVVYVDAAAGFCSDLELIWGRMGP
jgi:hypothetical protein